MAISGSVIIPTKGLETHSGRLTTRSGILWAVLHAEDRHDELAQGTCRVQCTGMYAAFLLIAHLVKTYGILLEC